MLSAEGVLRTEGFRYALDNGAFTAYEQSTPWNRDKFVRAVAKFGADADFIAAPDIVMGGHESLKLSLSWIAPLLSETRTVLIPVQNGMQLHELEPHLSERVGVFVGGDDRFKERTMHHWAALARSCGAWCHVGRVNTKRRIHLARIAGADSFDGSGASKYVKHLHRIERWGKQLTLVLREK